MICTPLSFLLATMANVPSSIVNVATLFAPLSMVKFLLLPSVAAPTANGFLGSLRSTSCTPWSLKLATMA